MTRIREEVSIAAPAERVWAVVHEDLKNAPKWSANLTRASRKGNLITYQLKLPAWKGSIVVEETDSNPFRKRAGVFSDGPLEGEWSYSYSERGGRTKLVYEMDYRLKGMLRFLGGALAGQYAAGIRDQMQSLKEYVESEKGPKAKGA